MTDTKFPRIYLRDDIDVENHDGIFHARNKARDGWSKEYVSVKEMNALIAEARAEIWHLAAGLYSTYHHTDKHPMDSDFARNCMKIAAELRGKR